MTLQNDNLFIYFFDLWSAHEAPLEESLATHSSILAWRIPWTEEPGGLQSMGSQRVGFDWSNLACTHKWSMYLASFFTFPICFKRPMMVEWSTLSSSATSFVTVRGPASTTALSWPLSTSYGWPLCSLSSNLLSPLQNSLNHHCNVSSSWANALLMLWVVSAALQPIFNLHKKITWICFLSNINSMV